MDSWSFPAQPGTSLIYTVRHTSPTEFTIFETKVTGDTQATYDRIGLINYVGDEFLEFNLNK